MTAIRVGFVGLGAMGAPMAGHVHRAGCLHAVWNRSPSRSEPFAAEHPGVTVSPDCETLAREVDVIALCVAADRDVLQVVEQLIPGLRPGSVVVDHSTVSPDTARRVAARLGAIGVGFVDAPVTGGVEGAMAGRLAVMVGGDPESVERARPVIECYARVWHHLGPAGAGQSAKAVNQLIVAGIAEAVCEALALVEGLDLPRAEMLELLSGGAAGSWFLSHRGKTMLEDRFESGFAPPLLLKDLRICRGLFDGLGADSELLKLAIDDYQALIDAGLNGADISSLIRLKRQRLGGGRHGASEPERDDE